MNVERLEWMPLKQYIILRKDAPTVTGAPVSPQKIAVMTAHASMCFLSYLVLEHCNANGHVVMDLDAEAFGWMHGPFTKKRLLHRHRLPSYGRDAAAPHHEEVRIVSVNEEITHDRNQKARSACHH